MEVDPEQQSFSTLKEHAYKKAEQTVQNVLSDKTYSADEAKVWIEEIGTQHLAELRDMSDGFKYILSTSIVQVEFLILSIYYL